MDDMYDLPVEGNHESDARLSWSEWRRKGVWARMHENELIPATHQKNDNYPEVHRAHPEEYDHPNHDDQASSLPSIGEDCGSRWNEAYSPESVGGPDEHFDRNSNGCSNGGQGQYPQCSIDELVSSTHAFSFLMSIANSIKSSRSSYDKYQMRINDTRLIRDWEERVRERQQIQREETESNNVGMYSISSSSPIFVLGLTSYLLPTSQGSRSLGTFLRNPKRFLLGTIGHHL